MMMMKDRFGQEVDDDDDDSLSIPWSLLQMDVATSLHGSVSGVIKRSTFCTGILLNEYISSHSPYTDTQQVSTLCSSAVTEFPTHHQEQTRTNPLYTIGVQCPSTDAMGGKR